MIVAITIYIPLINFPVKTAKIQNITKDRFNKRLSCDNDQLFYSSITNPGYYSDFP